MIGEIYTPPEIAVRAVDVLGGIDLDPASDTCGPGLIPAQRIFTREEDGLLQPWAGRVWLFPPHDGRTAAWVAKLIHEYRSRRTTEALLYTKLDARSPWWRHLAGQATVCFVAGSMRALTVTGSPVPRTRMAAILAYLGPEPERFAVRVADLGAVMEPMK